MDETCVDMKRLAAHAKEGIKWHGNWDGAGYPDRLEGERIPLIARILCIADVYDALTSTRSYRTAFSPEEALALMSAESGKSFDPELYEVFRTLKTSNGLVDSDTSAGPATERPDLAVS